MDLIEVQKYIVETVADIAVQGAVHPLSHSGLKLVT